MRCLALATLVALTSGCGKEETKPAVQQQTPEPEGWATTVLDDSPVYKGRPSIAVDDQGVQHIAYVAGTSADDATTSLWYARREGVQVVNELAVEADGVAREWPFMVLGQDGKPRIFFNAFDAETQFVQLYVVTRGTSGFGAPVALTSEASADVFAPVVALDDGGVAHLLASRVTVTNQYSVIYLQWDGATVSGRETVTASAVGGPEFAIAVGGDGTVHLAYCVADAGATPLYYRTRSAGGLSTEELVSAEAAEVWNPVMVTDAAGALHLVYSAGETKIVYHRQRDGSTFTSAEPLTTGDVGSQSYYQGLAASADGELHVAYMKLIDVDGWGMGDIFYRHTVGGVWQQELRLTETPEYDEMTPVVGAGLGGRVFVLYTENINTYPAGTVTMAHYLPPQ